MRSPSAQTGGPVLLADGDAGARHALRRVLESGPWPVEVSEAGTVSEMIARAGDVELVLADSDLHDVGVSEAIALLREHHPQLPIIVMSAVNDPEAMRAALDVGAISFLLKRGSPIQVRATVAAALDGHGLLDREVVLPMTAQYAALLDLTRRRDRAVIESLAAAVEVKDLVTSRHLRTVSTLATQLADLIDSSLAGSEDFRVGCLLHDVGKIGVPERILSKPGPLTDAEWLVMRRHPQAGASVIRPLGLAPVVEEIVLNHHERWDGAGYPNRLACERIPRAARIFSVCDALEAMTGKRPYREAITPDEAFEQVRQQAGHQFDPTVVAALEDGIGAADIELERTLALERTAA